MGPQPGGTKSREADAAATAMDTQTAACTKNEDDGWGRGRKNTPDLITPTLLPTRRWKHMGQLLLKLGDIPESLSGSTCRHALGGQRLDPEVRSSLLADTLHHVPPITGADLRGVDNAGLTWKYVDAADNMPVLPPPNRGPAIVNATTILYEGLQFCKEAASPPHSHAQNSVSNTAKASSPPDARA